MKTTCQDTIWNLYHFLSFKTTYWINYQLIDYQLIYYWLVDTPEYQSNYLIINGILIPLLHWLQNQFLIKQLPVWLLITDLGLQRVTLPTCIPEGLNMTMEITVSCPLCHREMACHFNIITNWISINHLPLIDYIITDSIDNLNTNKLPISN